MVVESAALVTIFSEFQATNKFIKLSKMCESVVCCRVNPSQKAEIVR